MLQPVLPDLRAKPGNELRVDRHDADALANPFYMLIPSWALYPMIGLATAAAVIASQAVITGVFSMVNQAIQLRYLQTLTQVAGDKSSTLVFPVPVDILGQLMGQARSAQALTAPVAPSAQPPAQA